MRAGHTGRRSSSRIIDPIADQYFELSLVRHCWMRRHRFRVPVTDSGGGQHVGRGRYTSKVKMVCLSGDVHELCCWLVLVAQSGRRNHEFVVSALPIKKTDEGQLVGVLLPICPGPG